jgi:hypothetical protein
MPTKLSLTRIPICAGKARIAHVISSRRSGTKLSSTRSFYSQQDRPGHSLWPLATRPLVLRPSTRYHSTIHRSPLQEPTLPPPTSLFHFHFPPGPQDASRADLPAYIDALTGETLTQGEVRKISLRVGFGLKNLSSINKGDVALIFSTNSLDYAIAFFACQAAGLIVSPASASYTPHELAYHMEDSTAKVTFIQADLLNTFRSAQEILKNKDDRWQSLPVYTLGPATSNKEETDAPSYDSLSAKETEMRDWDGEVLQSGQEHTAAVLCYSSGTVNIISPHTLYLLLLLFDDMSLTRFSSMLPCRPVYLKVNGRIATRS